mmetsp:Transcript_8910/g.27658  ORF Transcript_8910/g.27658 Transcript_8910/m.27658 type:complete len:104 (+) Transcript_8910:284-595(+)
MHQMRPASCAVVTSTDLAQRCLLPPCAQEIFLALPCSGSPCLPGFHPAPRQGSQPGAWPGSKPGPQLAHLAQPCLLHALLQGYHSLSVRSARLASAPADAASP